MKAATPKFNVLNVEKVLDQDINTETFFLYKVSCHKTRPFGDNQNSSKLTPKGNDLLRFELPYVAFGYRQLISLSSRSKQVGLLHPD